MLPKSCKHLTRVIQLANEVAREYDQEYVGTEHLLLAVAREGENGGAQVLLDQGITEHKLRAEVEKLIEKQMEETWVFGRLPGTPHFKNVMATAIKECQALEMPEVRSEHLVLALLREPGSVANQTLVDLGLDYGDVRQKIESWGKTGFKA
jgi:ATP-dependent Clp protease ATP-binding subunit ClpC